MSDNAIQITIPFIIESTAFKGGVGKTLVSSTLPIELARAGYRVLVIDSNWQSQTNHRISVRYDTDEPEGWGEQFYQWFVEGKPLSQVVVNRASFVKAQDGYSHLIDVIPSGALNMNAELWAAKNEEVTGQHLIELLANAPYDFVVVDTLDNGRLSQIVTEATIMANGIILLPSQMTEDDMDAILTFANYIGATTEGAPNVWVVPNRYDIGPGTLVGKLGEYPKPGKNRLHGRVILAIDASIAKGQEPGENYIDYLANWRIMQPVGETTRTSACSKAGLTLTEMFPEAGPAKALVTIANEVIRFATGQ